MTSDWNKEGGGFLLTHQASFFSQGKYLTGRLTNGSAEIPTSSFHRHRLYSLPPKTNSPPFDRCLFFPLISQMTSPLLPFFFFKLSPSQSKSGGMRLKGFSKCGTSSSLPGLVCLHSLFFSLSLLLLCGESVCKQESSKAIFKTCLIKMIFANPDILYSDN